MFVGVLPCRLHGLRETTSDCSGANDTRGTPYRNSAVERHFGVWPSLRHWTLSKRKRDIYGYRVQSRSIFDWKRARRSRLRRHCYGDARKDGTHHRGRSDGDSLWKLGVHRRDWLANRRGYWRGDSRTPYRFVGGRSQRRHRVWRQASLQGHHSYTRLIQCLDCLRVNRGMFECLRRTAGTWVCRCRPHSALPLV